MNSSKRIAGVSVVICTHNGASKLKPTIEHLRRQRVANDLVWEVVVVDNASNDGSGEIARRFWGDGPTRLRVVSEPELGEWNARLRGFAEARNEIIGFVDDDNWVAPDWVRNLGEIMAEKPRLGACGSILSPVFDAEPPAWFRDFQNYFAIVDESRISASAVAVCAAGMGVRAAAFRNLIEKGFRGHLTGRKGSRLESCCDVELCYALRLSGWGIAVEPSLMARHFMPRDRINWSYLRKLVAASAYSAAALDGYSNPGLPARRFRDSWLGAIAAECLQLLRHSPLKILKSRFSLMENEREVPYIDMRLARLRGLLALWRRYGEIRREIKNAPWRSEDRLLLSE